MDHCVHSECFMGLPISLWGDLKLTSSGGGGGGGLLTMGQKPLAPCNLDVRP